MTMGTITNFPITTILEYADRNKHGLCPQLCGYIHDNLNDCDLDCPVSERAISTAIQFLGGNLQYRNIGVGYNIYTLNDGITAQYNTISPDSMDITGFMIGNTVVLSAKGISTGIGEGQELSVQGGKYQYSQTLSANDIETNGTIIANPDQDDVLAKTFIYCKEPFEQNGSTYSLGLSTPTFENKTLITNQFQAPSAEGLVDFTYNTTMSAEYYWLPSDAEIRIYRNGNQPTSGQIGISVFYDHVIWAPNYGYEFGTTFTDTIQRFNLDTDNIDVSKRTVIVDLHEKGYSAINKNTLIYLAGGTNGSNYNNTISKYETKTDTHKPLFITTFTNGRELMASAKSPANSTNKAFFIGGKNTDYQSTIDSMFFQNETMAPSNNTLTTAKCGACATQNNTAMYILGGKSGPSTWNSRVDKILFSSETLIDHYTVISTARAFAKPYNTSLFGYFNGGEESTGIVQSIIQYPYSNDTPIVLNPLYTSVMTDIGNTFQKKTDGYYFHSNLVEKYNFSTDLILITNSEPYRNNQTASNTSSV